MLKVKIVASVFLLFALFLVGGCGGPTYGSPTTRTTIGLSQGEGDIYAILKDDWVQYGEEQMLQRPALMKKFRKGVSPVSTSLKRDRSYIFVALYNGEYTWIEETVSPRNHDFSLRILDK